MIDFAKKGNEERLISIWQKSFGDSREYVDFFFQNHYSSEDTLVCYYDGQETAELFLIDTQLKIKNKLYGAQYVYAACTLPEFRGRGFMKELICSAVKLGRKRNKYFTVLVPGSESLFDYYSKLGFSKYFKNKTIVFSKDDLKHLADSDSVSVNLKVNEIAAVRSGVFDCNAIVWNENAVDYAAKECLLTDGKVLLFENSAGQKGYAFCRVNENEVVIYELGAKRSLFGAAANEILKCFDCGTYKFILNAGFDLNGSNQTVRYNGMIKANDENYDNLLQYNENPYIGLTLE